MEHLGCLNEENRQALRALGAQVSDRCLMEEGRVEHTVVNYHIARVLRLRQELKDKLAERKK